MINDHIRNFPKDMIQVTTRGGYSHHKKRGLGLYSPDESGRERGRTEFFVGYLANVETF